MDSFVFNAKIIPNARKFQIMEFDSRTGMRLRVSAKPQKGLANQEIERELKKRLKTEVTIIRGQQSSRKTILVKLDAITAEKRIQHEIQNPFSA